jgi:hypothetical protein
VSWVDYDSDGHGDTSERDIGRHPFSYSGAFEEYPREPGCQLPLISYESPRSKSDDEISDKDEDMKKLLTYPSRLRSTRPGADPLT